MNWDAIATISAAISALAVVVSLIYLALQIRQANVQAQGVAHADWLTTWNDTIKGWIRDRETVQILQQGFADLNSREARTLCFDSMGGAYRDLRMPCSSGHWRI